MAEPTRIGSQLKALRKTRGWTQTDLADKAGIKRTALGAYEEGRAEPRLGVLVRLAHTLDVSLDTLVLGGTTTPLEQDLRILPIPRGQRLKSGTHFSGECQSGRWIRRGIWRPGVGRLIAHIRPAPSRRAPGPHPPVLPNQRRQHAAHSTRFLDSVLLHRANRRRRQWPALHRGHPQ